MGEDSSENAALMARYCDGDPAAFHELYRKLAPPLLGYLIGLIGERAAAEDLLQVAFLKLHEARDIYVRGADPVPWMYTIAHRTFLDEIRRRKRAHVKLTDEGELPVEPRAALSGAPESGGGSDSDGAGGDGPSKISPATLAALAQLPQNQREALVLTKIHGRTHAEAAAITGTSAGAIKLRAHRAYVTLRRLLGRGEAGEEKP